MFIQYREIELTIKLLVSFMMIIIFSLLNFHPIFADANDDEAVNIKNIKNFSFHYKQYSGRFYPDEVSISYSSDHKEIIYRDSRQSEYLIHSLDNTEEHNLIQIINNNRFFQLPNDLRIKCCNLTNTNLTVTINNMTHTSLWNVDAPIEIYKIDYAINHLADFTKNTYDSRTHLMTNGGHTTRSYDTAKFFFEYALSGKVIHGTYNRISYNSNTKELIVNCNASELLVEALCGPGKLGISHIRTLDNVEEDNLKQIINNNGFFNSSVSSESLSCSNCYIETLTVKLNDTTRTIRWSLTQGVVLPNAIFDTLRVLNYVASK